MTAKIHRFIITFQFCRRPSAGFVAACKAAHHCFHQVMRNAERKRITEMKPELRRRSLSRRRVRFFLRIKRNIFGRLLAPGRNEGGPGFSRLRRVLRRLARHGRDADEMLAAWALNLAPGKLLVTLQMLVASRAGEFEFAHSFEFGTAQIMEQCRPKYQCEILAEAGS